MTRELLQEANRLNHAIIEVEEQIRRVEELHRSQSLRISDASGNHITIDDVKLIVDITDMVIARLNQVKEDMYNRLLAL